MLGKIFKLKQNNTDVLYQAGIDSFACNMSCIFPRNCYNGFFCGKAKEIKSILHKIFQKFSIFLLQFPLKCVIMYL